MSPFTRLFNPTVHCDSEQKSASITSSALSTVRNAVAVPESELKRWRRIFDTNAKVTVDGEK
jgi:solute carrier family 25 (mitochondrial aspartate/glutamate transporter), member 12/13